MGARCSFEHVMGFSRHAWVDAYEWTFTLAPQEKPTRDELIKNAEQLKKQLK